MTADVILNELRRGERTTTELMEAAGVSRNACLCAIAGLNDGGHTILNVTLTGGHRDGRWRLTRDAERPAVRVCAVRGCGTFLSRYNASDYCLRHLHELAAFAISCRLAYGAEEVEDRELSTVF